jgi:hypothetical protein
MSETIAPNAAELIDLDFFKDDTTARLLGVITALGGEVYVLKAMVNRLTVALENQGVVSAETLAEAGASEAHRAWQAEEEKIFGAELLRPWLEPDEAPDVRRFMDME